MTIEDWNERATPALEDCIAHWGRMATGEEEEEEKPTSDFCACCQQFSPHQDDCGDCPIKRRTGLDSCDGTPYHAANTAWAYGNEKAFRVNAERMAEYLRETLRMVESGELTDEEEPEAPRTPERVLKPIELKEIAQLIESLPPLPPEWQEFGRKYAEGCVKHFKEILALPGIIGVYKEKS